MTRFNKKKRQYQQSHIQQKGFSLMELMIVVAIMGILASIAIPSYVEHVRQGKRADAKVELLKIAQMQESYFVQNMSYAPRLGAGAGTLGLAGVTIPSEQNEYTISMAVTPGGCNGTGANSCSTFVLTAMPTGNQLGDTTCLGFTYSNTGAKGITASGSSTQAKKCWK